ncbi:MAG: formaldehyde dehydrogenase, glutathione-independent [Bryobacteraceae bacterium]
MAINRGVAYIKPGIVEVQSIPYPKLRMPKSESDPFGGKDAPHGVILKVVTTNICGSDQHMVRGRTTAPQGLILGHEITGEVVEKGGDVEMLNVGDLVTVPFNIACGRCRNCREGNTGICLTVNPARPGAAYGYVDMGGWVGGQAEYVMVPYADFNLIRFPNKEKAMAKIRDLTLLSDIFPTGYHGAVTAGVTTGSIVYVAGAGPVGLASAASCHLLGAAIVIVGDIIPERLAQAKSFGCETVDLRKDASLADQIAQIVGEPVVDAAVDCVGFEARGHGRDAIMERPATVLNSIMEVTRAGGALGIPGLYVTGDPGGVDEAAKIGSLSIRIGLGWAKSHSFHTGQCPVLRYNRQLMQAILHDKVHIAKACNVNLISLDEAPKGYQDFDKGAAKKFVIDPHGLVRKAAA